MDTDPLVYLLPHLEQLDFTSAQVKVSATICTTFSFSAILLLSYIAFSHSVLFKYRLCKKDKLFWCLSIVRILFGLFSGFLGFWLVAFDNKLHKDIVNASSISIFIGTYVSMGFFIMDGIVVFGSIIISRKVDYGLVIHHILSSLSIIFIIYYEKGFFFLAVGLLCEIVEPFDCFSWMLQKANLNHLFVWKISQLGLIHILHCRTIFEGYALYKMYQQWKNVVTNMPVAVVLFITPLMLIQLFFASPQWAYKKMMKMPHLTTYKGKYGAKEQTSLLNGKSDSVVKDFDCNRYASQKEE